MVVLTKEIEEVEKKIDDLKGELKGKINEEGNILYWEVDEIINKIFGDKSTKGEKNVRKLNR